MQARREALDAGTALLLWAAEKDQVLGFQKDDANPDRQRPRHPCDGAADIMLQHLLPAGLCGVVQYAEQAAAGLPPGSLRTRITDGERRWAQLDARRLLAVAVVSRDAGQLQAAVQAARDQGLPAEETAEAERVLRGCRGDWGRVGEGATWVREQWTISW